MTDARLKKGDRVKLKGRDPKGIIYTMSSNDYWVCVTWDKGNRGPKYVHGLELEVI